LDDPSLISRHVPSSWKKLRIPAAALLFFALNTCTNQGTQGMDENSTRIVDQNEKKDSSEQITQNKTIIAPLFFHGSGIGATGCIAISPPVFISETDALELIRSKLEKEKLIFDKQDYIVEGIYSIDESEVIKEKIEKAQIPPEMSRHPFYFDFYSTKYNLGIKFISERTCYDLAEIRSLSQDNEIGKVSDTHPGLNKEGLEYFGSSVSKIDTIETAKRAMEYLRKYASVNAVFFYDPVVSDKKRYRNVIEDIEHDILEPPSDPKQLLGLQVDDFITWFQVAFLQSGKK